MLYTFWVAFHTWVSLVYPVSLSMVWRRSGQRIRVQVVQAGSYQRQDTTCVISGTRFKNLQFHKIAI